MPKLHGLFIGSWTIWVTLDILLQLVILIKNNKRMHQSGGIKKRKNIPLIHCCCFFIYKVKFVETEDSRVLVLSIAL